jgi:hypothetical protein
MYRVRSVVPSGWGVEICAAEEDDIHGNVVGGQLDDPAKFWEPVVGPFPLDGVLKVRDCRSDRVVQALDDGLQMRHLAPEPIVDVGVVR